MSNQQDKTKTGLNMGAGMAIGASTSGKSKG